MTALPQSSISICIRSLINIAQPSLLVMSYPMDGKEEEYDDVIFYSDTGILIKFRDTVSSEWPAPPLLAPAVLQVCVCVCGGYGIPPKAD